MKCTYSIKGLKAETAAAVRRAEKGKVLTITRHEKPVAVMISHKRVAAIAETLKILGDPEAMEIYHRGAEKYRNTLRELSK